MVYEEHAKRLWRAWWIHEGKIESVVFESAGGLGVARISLWLYLIEHKIPRPEGNYILKPVRERKVKLI